jgi:hypothetical protein
MTRALVGLPLQSLQVLDGEVSVPQYRLLFVLSGLGGCRPRGSRPNSA